MSRRDRAALPESGPHVALPPGLLTEAQSGDRFAAWRAVRIAAVLIDAGHPLPADLDAFVGHWAADRLGEISRGEEPRI